MHSHIFPEVQLPLLPPHALIKTDTYSQKKKKNSRVVLYCLKNLLHSRAWHVVLKQKHVNSMYVCVYIFGNIEECGGYVTKWLVGGIEPLV